MSKKANPALIGIFVIAALIIAIAGILVLGSGTFFKHNERFVLYFDGNLSGLDVGAPVQFGGIRIGEVVAVYLEYNTENEKTLLPVYIEIDKSRIQYVGSNSEGRGLQYQIEEGLRAQLQSQSFITGKLKIMLVSAPQTPVNLVGGDPLITEIPTIPSLLESLSKSFEELPLTEIIGDLKKVTESVSEFSSSGELTELVAYLKETAQSLSELTKSEELRFILSEFQETTEAISSLAESPLLLDALREFTTTLQSARYLFDYLERHPEALLRGKGEE